MGEIGLEEAIRAVRAELTQAMSAGAGEAIRFRVKSVELDFQVTIGRSADTGAKVRFWVVDVSASGKVERAAMHTVHVALDPVMAGGGEVEVTDLEPEKPI